MFSCDFFKHAYLMLFISLSSFSLCITLLSSPPVTVPSLAFHISLSYDLFPMSLSRALCLPLTTWSLSTFLASVVSGGYILNLKFQSWDPQIREYAAFVSLRLN